MYGWRVTKYDPAFRDKNGAYQRAEWTSVSDIGRVFGGQTLSLDDYRRTEDAYIAAVTEFLHDANDPPLLVRELQQIPDGDALRSTGLADLVPEAQGLRDGQLLSPDEVLRVCRLNLREVISCKLEASDAFYVHFGYDFYMYIGSKHRSERAVSKSRQLGLFVEEMKSPYLVG